VTSADLESVPRMQASSYTDDERVGVTTSEPVVWRVPLQAPLAAHAVALDDDHESVTGVPGAMLVELDDSVTVGMLPTPPELPELLLELLPELELPLPPPPHAASVRSAIAPNA
jgi:hypothetical protein